MKVYISGGITKDFNYMEKFKNAEEKISRNGSHSFKSDLDKGRTKL